MEVIFPVAAHMIYAYHLAQNLKRFYKQRGDMIWLYYCATYVYRIEEFDHAMAELKKTYRKVYDELLDVGIKKFSHRTDTLQRCEINPIHLNKFKVDDKWKETTVVLDERSFSCREWDLDELPCYHALAVASICKPAKKARICNICKKEGHSRLKCPNKPHDPTLIDMDEAEDNATFETVLNQSKETAIG
ncbi:hypothetical protein Ddye_029117 [Dipteronia dyeriana]|uniref:SWIM-type domain-containing protein n=1 Tax=Dipteronia dyeriana TaxID=168575 RepID=A0AAD9TDS7_9ROSI|nr:hypothetical protein Ddye_029117 [Dipteronia dyeriana]